MRWQETHLEQTTGGNGNEEKCAGAPCTGNQGGPSFQTRGGPHARAASHRTPCAAGPAAGEVGGILMSAYAPDDTRQV